MRGILNIISFLLLFTIIFTVNNHTISFAQEKSVKIMVKQIGDSAYSYKVINYSSNPIAKIKIGFNYHMEGNEEELTMIPTDIESPMGWVGNSILLEESNYLHISWKNLDSPHLILPGQSLDGFIVYMPQPYDLMLQATFTVIYRNGTRLAGRVEIEYDITSPSTSLFLNGTEGKDNWYSSNVKVTLNSVDSYSGVKEIRYVLDGATTTVSGSTGNILINSDGIHTISYWAVDNADNIEKTKTTEIKIDKTPPIITATVNPSPNANGWHNTNVTVSFICEDTLSGIALCPLPVMATTEGEGQVITGTAVDKAGNAATTSVTLSIDKTPPSGNISVTPGLLWPPNHKMVNVTVNGGSTDLTSGVASVVFTVIDEYGKVQPAISGFNTTIPLEAWREGTDMDGRHYTIIAVITDKAGNTTTVTTEAICPHDMRQ